MEQYANSAAVPDPGLALPPAPVSVRAAFRFWLKLGFISFGGPLVETTHNDRKFTAPLTAITAALLRCKRTVIEVIVTCAGVGLVYQLVILEAFA